MGGDEWGNGCVRKVGVKVVEEGKEQGGGRGGVEKEEGEEEKGGERERRGNDKERGEM